MKSTIQLPFVMSALVLVPAVASADVYETNDRPGFVLNVTMTSEIFSGPPGTGTYTYYYTFSCEHYLNYGESIAYADSSGDTYSYQYHLGNTMWICNQGPYPNVIDADAWRSGGMDTYYYNIYGESQFDMNLHWSPGAHDSILNHALTGKARSNIIDKLKGYNRTFDSHTQSASDSHMHSMRESSKSVEEAISARDDFINLRINAARAAALYGDLEGALDLLAQALHPVMDYSSPMHTDLNGTPKIWRGIIRDGWGHSPNDLHGNERNVDITSWVFDLEDPLIQGMFVEVFRGTPLEAQVFADGFDPNSIVTGGRLPHN